MAWLVVIIILGCWWNCLDNERALREVRRLQREMDADENVKPRPESLSPDQLLGDVARPLMTLRRGRRLAKAAFRSCRAG